MKLGSKTVLKTSKPYIIAEIGVNHEGCLKKAKELIAQAKEGGADAAKFQTYKAETLVIPDSPSYWDRNKEKTESQYKLFKKYDSFNELEYIELADYCNTLEIDFLSTGFDEASIDFLDPLMMFYKVSSSDITNVPLLRKIASKGKPILLSTGASTIKEIDNALKTIWNSGKNQVGLLHCVLNYPTSDKDANLKMIKHLKRVYPNQIIGYSDHTLPDESMTTLTSAYLMGAVVLEKHFTDNKNKEGNDHYHSMDKNDLKNFIERVNLISKLIGDSREKAPIPSEELARENARRSIVTLERLKEGELITTKNITCKRPGNGISADNWDKVIGKVINQDIDRNVQLDWSQFQS